MRKFSLKVVATLIMALGLAVSGAMAKKVKPSAEHTAAIKKCNADYTAAVKTTTTVGIERQRALADAKARKQQCIASAPK